MNDVCIICDGRGYVEIKEGTIKCPQCLGTGLLIRIKEKEDEPIHSEE